MPIALYRIDDRLIHGQVVVGWGTPLNLGFIVLVDDTLAASEWEQDLYRMGVPPNVDVVFASVDSVAAEHRRLAGDTRPGIVLTGDVATMLRVVDAVHAGGSPAAPVRAVNVGGIHHRTDRTQKLRYVFLNADEAQGLRDLAARGIEVTAQDLPSAKPVALADILIGCRD